jgi:hypothetical protein
VPAVTAGNDALTLPRLAGDFDAVATIVCGEAVEHRPDGAELLVATESRADDVTSLVAALRLPDKPRTDNPCTADAVVAPWLVLLDGQGRWIRPGVAVDGCGKPRIEVRTAVEKLRLTRVSTRTLRQITSAEAAAVGCGQRLADMIWAVTNTGTATGTADLGALYDGPATVRLCAYRVPTSEQRTAKPAGDFVYGRSLPGEQWAAIRRAVQTAPAATTCTTPANRFALLVTEAGELYVELDGCTRIMALKVSGREAVRQASPGLIALLAER